MKTFKSLIILFGTVLAITGCSSKKAADAQSDSQDVKTELVKTEVLDSSQITRVIQLSTNLEGYETVNVAPSVTGKIDHIFVEIGSYVPKGQMLIRMDEHQYLTTKLQFANLGLEMNRLEALKKSGSVSEQTYDQTKLQYDQTQANLDYLEKNTYVKAPFSGMISAKNYEDGELYSGQTILTLTRINLLKAYINVPESYFPMIKVGMKLTLSTDIYPNQKFPAIVEVIAPTVDPATHTFQLKIKIQNAGEKLRPGMYVNTELDLDRVNALMVPYESVMRLVGSDQRYMFKDVDGVARRVIVNIGQRIDDKIEVTSDSLKQGDKIVVVGQTKLIDGEKLKEAK